MGTMRIRRTGERFTGVHRPLVPASVFERVQAVLDGRSFTHLQNHDFTFRRLFRCATCGRSLTGSLQKGRVYYRCHMRGCIGASIREDAIDTRVRLTLRSVTFARELRALLHVGLRRRKETSVEAIASQRRSLDAELARADAKLARLTDAFLDEAIDRELFQSRKSELLVQRAQIHERIEECDSDGNRLFRRAEEKLQLAESAVYLYEIATPDEKRRLLDRITCNRVGTGRNVQISLLPPFCDIADVLDFRKCAHHQDEVATNERLEPPFDIAVGEKLIDLTFGVATENEQDAKRLQRPLGP
jgi:hypothetical protein